MPKSAYFHIYSQEMSEISPAQDDRDRHTFMQLLGETVNSFRLRLFAYCLMDHYYHLFLQTLEANLTEAMEHFSRNYFRYFNERHKRANPEHKIRHQFRLVNHQIYALSLIRYIHQNPINAGIAKELHEYRWSSYAYYTGYLPPQNWLNCNWILQNFAPTPALALPSFIHFHKLPSTENEQKRLTHFRFSLR